MVDLMSNSYFMQGKIMKSLLDRIIEMQSSTQLWYLVSLDTVLKIHFTLIFIVINKSRIVSSSTHTCLFVGTISF